MKSHKELLHMYFLHTENELEENVKEYANRIRRRSHDSIDFLKLMLAEERLQAFNEFRSNILNLLNIGDNKENWFIKTAGTVSAFRGIGSERGNCPVIETVKQKISLCFAVTYDII